MDSGRDFWQIPIHCYSCLGFSKAYLQIHIPGPPELIMGNVESLRK